MDSARKTGILVGGFLVLALAVTLLAWLAGHDRVPVEAKADSPDPNERGAAAAALGRSADPKATARLRRMARDSDPWVAIKAIRALGRVKSDDRRDTLAAMVADKSLPPAARAEAAATLGSFEQARPEVLTETLAKEPDPRVRVGAAKGLVRLRKPQTIPQLVKALEDPDPRVRAYAITAIHHMITRHYNFDPQAPVGSQRKEIARLKAYLKQCGVLE